MGACPNRKETIPKTVVANCPHCKSRLGQAHLYADDWDEEERSGISGLRMSMTSVALILLLVAVILIWQWLPSYYLWNYIAGATIWLLAISIPIIALVALVSSILDLLRISGTGGGVVGKRSAVAGLILSFLVLILCVFFFLSFKAPDSSQKERAGRSKAHFTAKPALSLSKGRKVRKEKKHMPQSSQRTQRKTEEEILEPRIHTDERRYNNISPLFQRGLGGFCRGAKSLPRAV